MKILFPLVRASDFMLIDSLLRNDIYVDIILNSNNLFFETAKKQLDNYKNYYITDNFHETLIKLVEKNNYDFIFPSFNDPKVFSIAESNEKCNMLGIKSDTARLTHNKKIYYQIWKDLKIACPTVYHTIPAYEILPNEPSSVKFPCIVKPSRGTGSVGVQIIENEQSLIEFFADTDKKTHQYQESHGLKFKKMQYFCQDNDYLIQEYIAGSVVSFIGHIHQEKINLDFIFDIESKSYPYAAETGLSYPSKYSEQFLKDGSIEKLKKFFKNINLDNTAFMLDLIVDANGEVYFIDFSPRLSVSHTLMWHAGEKEYGCKLAKKLMYGTEFEVCKNKSVLFRSLPFEKKQIKSIDISNKEIPDDLSLPKGEIQLVRNDVAVFNNGWAIFTGNTLEETEEKYQNFISGLTVIYAD